MKNSSRYILSYLLGIAMLVLTVPAPLSSSSTSATGGCKSQQGNKPIEKLKGEAAKLRVLQLRASNKAFNRAMKDMEKMGKKPNWDLSLVVLHGEKAISQAKPPTFRAASYTPPQDGTYASSDGEMTFITYDGPDHIWEGTVYASDYSDGQSYTYNGAMDDYYSENPTDWQVTDEVYYPPDGGDPSRGEPCSGNACLIVQAPVINKSGGMFLKASFINTTGAPTAPRPVWNFLRRFFSCFFRSFGYFYGNCPPHVHWVTCLINATYYAGWCCGYTAKNSIGSPPGSGWCY